jgi:hypothetical protein
MQHTSKNNRFKKEKAMKAMIGVLVVMIMAFALVSSGEAGTFSCDNCVAMTAGHNIIENVSAKDAGTTGLFPCGAEPAYPGYINARAVPCTANTLSPRVPDPMGAVGY